jgi:ubiquinone/menaquinone biosynthesis C-methylase UbiE
LSNSAQPKKRLFDIIAPIYGLFYNRQITKFGAVLASQTAVDISAYKTVLDVGCGTGALCDLLNQMGLSVTGIDSSTKMLSIASSKNQDTDIQFTNASALLPFPFIDNSFDISFASYVAHGMSPDERQIMYENMSRVTRHLMIIYDYNAKRSPLTSLIEWVERGDYFNFIRCAKTELEEQFAEVRVVNVDKRAAWYICTVGNTK